MSIKSFIQIFILILIVSIISFVYLKYFQTNKDIVEEINSLELGNQEQLKKLEKKIADLEIKNDKLVDEIHNNKSDIKNTLPKNDLEEINQIDLNNKIKQDIVVKKVVKSDSVTKNEIKNLIKDVVYSSIDDKGNKFYLLANSAKSDLDNKDILDLINVRGEISSEKRDTIYIVSDFAEFNTINSNSKFYDNVIINYQEKKITSVNFDINMETNKAIAYNNVIITDPKSIMKAGIVEFDLKTKNININPETTNSKIEVITN